MFQNHGVAEVSTTGNDQPPWQRGAFGPECQGDATRVPRDQLSHCLSHDGSMGQTVYLPT